MSFLPAIPLGGYGGWRVLQATSARQQATFEKTPSLQRDIEYFRENISKATSAEALVSDRRLLKVALGAFGLAEELDKKAFVRRVLEEGTEDPKSFANRLNEPRYLALVKAFNFSAVEGAAVDSAEFREDIIARYKAMEFERAVGEVDADMRLALNFKREIAELANNENVDKTGWFRAMGRKPIREFLTVALGLPDALAKIDVDRQKEVFEAKAKKMFGDKSLGVFKSPEAVDDAIRRFFLFKQMQSGPSMTTPGAGALVLLQNSALGGASAANLFLSQT